jgi:hypothetical protein
MAEYSLDTSLAHESWQKLDAFTQGYIEAAMWTLTDEDGQSLDYLGLHDIAEETIAKAFEECQAFQDSYAEALAEAGTPSQNGHDFWLTRNGHGAGFWDRGYMPWVDKELTDGAHACGNCDWYVGDDGFVYEM